MTEPGVPTAAPGEAPPRRFGPASSEAWAFLELFAIAGLAITQPALDLLSKNVSILVNRDAGALEVVFLALAIALAPPAAAWVVEALVGLALPRARRFVHAALVGGFAGLLAEEVLKRATGLGPTSLVVLGGAAAVAAAVLVLRLGLVRQFLRFLAIAPAAFVALFLVASPASALVVGGTPGSLSGERIERPHRVVMIVLDEFPLETLLDGTGRVDAQLFPNFAALTGTANWYRNSTSVAPFTEQAVPALLTGRYPRGQDTVPIASQYPDSVFRLLGGAYRMNVHETVTDLCSSQVCPNAPGGGELGALRSVRGLLRDSADLWWDFASPEETKPPTFLDAPSLEVPQLRTVRQFLSSLQPSDAPTFDFLHVLLPHQPWRYLPGLQDVGYVKDDPANLANLIRWRSDWTAELGRERHLLQAMATDAVIGKIVAKLQRIGAWDDSLFVVTADHGIAFSAGEGVRSASDRTADQILWTPLMVKLPGQTEGVVDDRPVTAVDVVPTIADVIGADAPWEWDGVSALGRPRAEFARRFYQWREAEMQPDDVPVADPSGYLTFDGASHFPKVLTARAAPPGGDPGLRPYRIGEYGALVGQAAAPWAGPAATSPSRVSVQDPAIFEAVDPTLPTAPWTWVEGYAFDLDQDQTLAFAVNGTIAGFGRAEVITGRRTGFYWASLAPQFFTAGRNEVQPYVVSGPPGAPVLSPLPIA